MLPAVGVLNAQKKAVEKSVLAEGKRRSEIRLLKTAPGIGITDLRHPVEWGDYRP